jgi:hypothetical protein
MTCDFGEGGLKFVRVHPSGILQSQLNGKVMLTKTKLAEFLASNFDHGYNTG